MAQPETRPPSGIRPLVPRRRHRVVAFQTTSLLEAFGGIEYYLDDTLAAMVDLYGPGSVRTLVPRHPDREGRAWSPAYEVTPVPFTMGGLLAKVENRYSPRLFRAGRDAIRAHRPTILVCGHVSLAPLVFALSRLTKVPFVTVAYGIEIWGNTLPHDDWCFRQGAGVISISHWTKRVLADRGVNAGRIAIVHPALPSAYEKFPAPRRERTGREAFTLLTVSRLDAGEQYKGQDHVIEALSRLRIAEPKLAIRYVIQGDGTDRARLEALVEEKGLADVVEFRPRVADRREFENIYREADLYIMPSRYGYWDGKWRGEGFGIVYVEAAAFGVPSIAYACGGATDIIRNGENGVLVEPDNIAELARAIESFARAPKRAFDMGKRAYDVAMQEFTRPAVRNEIVRALDRL